MTFELALCDKLPLLGAAQMAGRLLLLALLVGTTAAAQPKIDALQLHRRALVFDAHCDTLLRVVRSGYQLGERHNDHHIDLPRLQEGGIDVQGFALWVDPRREDPPPARQALDLLAAFEDQLQKNADRMALVRGATEARKVLAEGKVGALLAIEGGYAIDNDVTRLSWFYDRGVRYMTLVWMKSHDWADSSDDEPRWGGLNDLGRSVVREMNRLGMMIDLSHASDETVQDVLAVSKDPVILTHSCARALCNIPRNVSDETLRAVAERGGVIGVNYYIGYLVDSYAQARKARHELRRRREQELREEYGPESERFREERRRLWENGDRQDEAYPGGDTDYRVIVDHIDHMVKVAGVDHVGLGSDFDGVSRLPVGLNDAADVPKITQELVARGYSESDIDKILGENFMRVFAQVCGR